MGSSINYLKMSTTTWLKQQKNLEKTFKSILPKILRKMKRKNIKIKKLISIQDSHILQVKEKDIQATVKILKQIHA